ncbi:TPA: hypothetical protein ACX6NV_000550 [Photobacterium damselae]
MKEQKFKAGDTVFLDGRSYDYVYVGPSQLSKDESVIQTVGFKDPMIVKTERLLTESENSSLREVREGGKVVHDFFFKSAGYSDHRDFNQAKPIERDAWVKIAALIDEDKLKALGGEDEQN